MLQFTVANVGFGSTDLTELLPDIRFSVQTDKISIRDLIARTVEQQIADMLDTHERTVCDTRLLLDKQYLSEQDIKEQARSGKIAVPHAIVPKPPTIDISAEIKRAQHAFEQQRYMIFINGCQIFALAESIAYDEVIDVKFMRLTPLAGG